MPISAVIAGIPAIFSGLSGLFGGGQQQKVTTNGTITNSGTQTGTGTSSQSGGGSTSGFSQTNPNLSPLQQQLAAMFTKGAGDLYNQSTDLSGYTSGGLANINKSGDLANQLAQNSLASRGLSYSNIAPVVQNNNNLNRLNQGVQFQNQVPLVQRQLQEGALGDLMKAFQVLPTGTSSVTGGSSNFNTTGNTTQNQTSNNTQTQQGTNIVSGNPMGGLFGGLGQGLSQPGGLLSILGNLFPGGGGGGIPGLGEG